jgi:hypothetical protein
MAKRRRLTVASPNEAISTTLGLLTPKEGPEIKSTFIKYQNVKVNSKLYDLRKAYLDSLSEFLTARYKLQQAGYFLQMSLDEPLTRWRSDKVTGEPISPALSRSKHWKFQLKNKTTVTVQRKDKDGKEIGEKEIRIVTADMYCFDTPDEDFTLKLRTYLPEEKADELEIGFLDLGDDNDPAKYQASKQPAAEQQGSSEVASGVPVKEPSEEPEDGSDEGAEEDTNETTVSDDDMRHVLEMISGLPDEVTSATVQAFGKAYKNLSNMPAKAYFFLQLKTDKEKAYFYQNALNKPAKAKLKEFLGPEDFEYDKAVGE